MAQPHRSRPARSEWRRLRVAGLVAAAVMPWAVVTLTSAEASPTVSPDVTGASLAQARERLAEAGYDTVVTVPSAPPAPEDVTFVVGQLDVTGPDGEEVELRVRPEVPSVIDQPVDTATEALAERGLVADPSESAGEVVGQSPQEGETPPFGGIVTLDVQPVDEGTPPAVDRVEVPSVTGLVVDDARSLVAQSGLESGLRVRGRGDPGPVVDQEPPAGTAVGAGTLVTLISEGQATSRVVVPDITGQDVRDAGNRLADAGLALDVVTRPEDVTADAAGTIRDQSPQPGTEVDPGTVVTGYADALVAVPDLRGLTMGDAEATLADASLTLSRDPQGAEDAATVSSQSPAAGDLVPAGSVVSARVGVVATTPTSWWPWAAGGVVLLLILALGMWLGHSFARARERRWVRSHVGTRVHPAPPRSRLVPSTEVRQPSITVQLLPHHGTQHVETAEVSRT